MPLQGMDNPFGYFFVPSGSFEKDPEGHNAQPQGPL
jgi:hypothetical protein